jgi:hypothetical protein
MNRWLRCVCGLLPAILAYLTVVPLAWAADPAAGGAPSAAGPAEISDAALADAWARVLVRSNPGPYQYVAYEVTSRGVAGVASHTVGVMGRRDAIIKTELMAKAELKTLLQQLQQAGAWELPALAPPVVSTVKTTAKTSKKVKKHKGKVVPTPSVIAAAEAPDPLQTPPQSAVPVYELSVRLGGKEHTILVTDPFGQNDRRYTQVLGLIRDAAIRTAGDIGFPGTTGSSRPGYVYVDSVPSARVWIDGALAQETTPLLNWSLSPGKHTVEFEQPGQPTRKAFPVQIRPGLTTTLEVDLRD